MRASVVVPMRNAGEGALELLRLLHDQTVPDGDYEVLVVDDDSRDDTAEIVERSGMARSLRMPSWGGAWAARNMALREAQGAAIAFTDADCRPEPDWLERGLEDLDRLDADLVAGHIEVPLGERPGVVELVDFSRFLDQERSLAEAGFGATANLFVKREVVDSVGFFSDDSIEGGDLELCVAATRAGFKLVYSPRAVVHHEPRTKGLSMARRAFRDGYGQAQWVKQGGSVRADLDHVFTHPGAWIPGSLLKGGRIYGIERVEAKGLRLSRARMLAMALAEWAFIQLPMIAGDLTATVRGAVRR